MRESAIEATVFFQHSANEVAGLNEAVIPLSDQIHAVASARESSAMRRILSCEYFRAREARYLINLLQRATKYARANLTDYFPLMRPDVLDHIQALENAVTNYRTTFEALKERTVPTH